MPIELTAHTDAGALLVARVPGRVRSCPRSLMAAANTTPSRRIRSSDAAKAPARRSAPAATATS